MKIKILAATCIGIVILCIVLALTAPAQPELYAGKTGLKEYRVISEIALGDVTELFLPNLSGGKKFLSPMLTGVGVYGWWNPRLKDTTKNTMLLPGDTIWLPGEWVPRGIQQTLEPVEMPTVMPSGAAQSDGQRFWMLNIAMLLCAAVVFGIYLYSRSWGKA